MSKIFEQTLAAVLQDEIDVLGVMKIPVKFEDIWVVHVHLQFDFHQYLIFHLSFDDLCLI